MREALQPVRGQRLSGGVVEQFHELLRSGELKPGDRLPPERELAVLFGVGRNSVREALRQLDTLGLVESRRGDGTYVREANVSSLIAPFRAVIALSSTAVEDVLAFRKMFEPEVAAMAAQALDDDGRERLERALRRFEDAVGGGDRPREADSDFHFAIACATKNALVIGVEQALMEVLGEFRSRLREGGYDASRRAARGHQALFGAIVARDADGAREAMAAHLADVEEHLSATP